jgi:ribonuclease P protein component
MKIQTLKRSAEFKRVRGGRRFATALFIIEGRRRVAPSVLNGAGVPSRRRVDVEAPTKAGRLDLVGELHRADDQSASKQDNSRAEPGFAREAGPVPASLEAGPAQSGGPRFGFTITKKVGNAVVRNRIRRRLREALRTLDSPCIEPDFDYVVVASRATHDYPFAGLQDALREAFERLHLKSDGGSGQDRGQSGRSAAGRGRRGGSVRGAARNERAVEVPAGSIGDTCGNQPVVSGPAASATRLSEPGFIDTRS